MVPIRHDSGAAREEGTRGGSQPAAGQEHAEATTESPTAGAARGGPSWAAGCGLWGK